MTTLRPALLRGRPQPSWPATLAALVGLATFIASLLIWGCGSTPERVILSANDLQDTAAHAYDAAKAQEAEAGRLCAAVVQTPSMEACRAAGVPIPYDPERLRDLAGPINAAYEAIRAAETIRLAVKAGTAQPTQLASALMAAAHAISHLYQAAADLGIRLDLSAALQLEATASKAVSK